MTKTKKPTTVATKALRKPYKQVKVHQIRCAFGSLAEHYTTSENTEDAINVLEALKHLQRAGDESLVYLYDFVLTVNAFMTTDKPKK